MQIGEPFEPQLEIFPRELLLRRVDAGCNMRRFYRMSLQRDLFGGVCLLREWGRIGARGQMLSEFHPDEGQAINALMKHAKTKIRRGYSPY